jgi:predicted nucleic acid-binding protein
MRILFDVNVILDFVLRLEPWVADAEALVAAAELSRIEGLLCADSPTTIHYLAARSLGERTAREWVGGLLRILRVAPVDHGTIEAALRSAVADFEDAVLHECARRAEADGIVTRDADLFAGTPEGPAIWRPSALRLVLEQVTERP